MKWLLRPSPLLGPLPSLAHHLDPPNAVQVTPAQFRDLLVLAAAQREGRISQGEAADKMIAICPSLRKFTDNVLKVSIEAKPLIPRCPGCGEARIPGFNYCPRCGKSLKETPRSRP